MNPGALAEDAVSVRRLRAVGVSGHDVRRQLAAVPIPPTRRFVFVRRVVLRTRPDEIGHAMTTALARLAEDSRTETLAFADFPALVVACARAASTGGLAGGGGGWHWRALGLSRTAGLGEAVGALLRAYPLEAAAATVALAANGLLAPVWRDLSEFGAAQLTAALGVAARFSPPSWPDEADLQAVDDAGLEADSEPALARAAAFWGPALHGLPRRHEAVRTAATLSLMRWSPMSLQAPSGPLWPRLLARLSDPVDLRMRAAPTPAEPFRAPEAARAAPPVNARPPIATDEAERPAQLDSKAPRRGPASPTSAWSTSAPSAISSTPTADASGPEAGPLADSLPHGEFVSTAWGGVLFLINALNRLDIAARLTALGPAAPSGWRALADLGLALGMPSDEPLAEFLAAQDLASPPPPGFCEQLLNDMQALYASDEAWPPPLQEPARLLANETHLDLDLMTRRVNIMIRRVGLDIDPGWVPWLGRIVAFHYPNVSPTHTGGA